MTRSYEISLDRERCDGVFACMVHDDIHLYEDVKGEKVGLKGSEERDGIHVAEYTDGSIEEARRAASACPPDALRVEASDGEE